MGSASFHADKQLTAFLQLESAMLVRLDQVGRTTILLDS